jgi:tetratricopeptide (TPR) repeat protein
MNQAETAAHTKVRIEARQLQRNTPLPHPTVATSKLGGLAGGRSVVWQTHSRAKVDAELEDLNRQLELAPRSLELHFRRGVLLVGAGRLGEAAVEFWQILQTEPFHRGALNNLGDILAAAKYRGGAEIVYREAVKHYPQDPVSRVNLGHFLLDKSEGLAIHEKAEEALKLQYEAREHFEQALASSANFEKAHEGLSYVLEHIGEKEKAAWHRREAFKNRYIIPLPCWGGGKPVRVLKLVSTTGGNVRLQRFLDPRRFQTCVVIPEFYDASTPLPEHQLVVNAIGDAEVSYAALAAAQSVLALSSAPVVNPPAAVLATTRSNNARRLSKLSGVVTPITATLARERLIGSDAPATLASLGFEFPLLLRAPGFHGGLHFLRVAGPEALPQAVSELPGQEVTVMQYLDARGSDGKTRKYRVMFINGQMYPLHVAVSSNWKIHFFTAEMAESAENRAEDAAFLENMAEVVGPRAMRALQQIQSVLGLDYGGIDFGLNQNGELLLFEANATMVVNPPEPDERWKYRAAAWRRIRTAATRMLNDRARRTNAIIGQRLTTARSTLHEM